ncbi:adhesion G protein-coupled receptor E5-like isoform X2 [Engystomops pustulosus]|uniref:adhesion G protein-coupled receptor E5-like isoform X2 n=1 Tax=Engystomops pustulosus TaxID=76066 RepID=UPI003AFB19BB
MLRFWIIGISVLPLLINGLIGTSHYTSPSTGVSKRRSGVICRNGTLPPNVTECSSYTCPMYQTDNGSYSCPPGYITDKDDCKDIDECRTAKDLCGAFTHCRNTPGGYSCTCDPGYHKGNETEFCPSDYKEQNACTDIDECSDNPRRCGSNLICKNTPGAYKCECDKGYQNITNTCVVKCKYNARNDSCEDKSFQCNLKKFSRRFTPYCENVTSQGKPSVLQLLGGMDDLIDDLSHANKTERLQRVGELLSIVEATVQTLALLDQKTVSYANTNETIRIQVSNGKVDEGTLSVKGKGSHIQLDSKAAAGNTGLALLGSIEYTNITHILNGSDLFEEKSENKSFTLVSPVVSVFLGISNTSNLQQPVSMRLNFTAEVKFNNFSCVSWSVSENSWSSKGCMMVESDAIGITCNCTHLTSFAILMLLQEYESWTLTLLTQIGLSISIFCLVLAIITFCFCRSIRGTRNIIHTHLCVSLFFANCIFLLGITASGNKVVCGIVAGLLHAFYLSSFCWMSLEGLELYRMLVTVFNTHLKKRYLLAVGYGTPALIVTISAVIYHEGYGTKEYCWLSRKNGFIWAFMGPVCLIILLNCGIFVLVVWKLAVKMSSINPEHGKLKKIRTLTVTSLAQLCILGSCWGFGFFMFDSAKPVFVYIFTILNTLQGLQIFVLHCLMHKKVRAEYKMWLCALAHFKSPIYSEFSNTSNTQSNTKAKTSKESGL